MPGSVRSARRWSDLIQVGIGCSQEIADLLVKAEFIDRVDRDLEGARSQTELVARMTDVLIDLGAALSDMPQIPSDRLAGLVEQHTLLMDVLLARRPPSCATGPSEPYA